EKSSFHIIHLGHAILTPVYLAYAQKQATIPRIGVLLLGAPPNANLDAFIQGLQELGYIEGKNIFVEYRFAEGKADRLPELAMELVRLKVAAIFTTGTPAIFALKRATNTVPIVFFSTSDPIGTGVVASLARPGGNITGITVLASDLWPKRLELLKEIVPKLSRVAMVWNRGNAGMALEAKATQEVAGPLGVTLQDRGVKDPNELDTVLALMIKDRPDGFLALMDPVLNSYQKRILDFLAQNRLPAIFENKTWVEAGGLISYGANYAEAHRRAAALMDKVLKGTKPADLPVEQPTRFELVINLKTAKQIALTIPQSVLYRADRVIK
ncbi:MAG TPA: ABC transporter substrate-binding protein, partial [Candidatus Binatia bacterium]|nr:ABC transporter substrate-binding protein [Candidatus Binatia bacterium]